MSYARLAGPNMGEHVRRSVAARPLDRAETFFGALPAPDTRSEAGSTPAAADEPPERGRSARWWIANHLGRFARPIFAGWRIPRWRRASGERLVATFGSVEIRQTSAARVAQTCVKGDAAQARATALRRLAKYASGDNRGAVALCVERPVMQQQIEPRRWLVSVRLSNEGNPRSAPVPMASKIQVVAWEPETLAVPRMDGRPSHDLISFGDAIILDAISCSAWAAVGSARIRLHVPRYFPWLVGGFEVVVPVTARNANGMGELF